MEENKETLELLKKIERANRHQVWSGYIRSGLILVCAVCMVALVVMVARLMPQINEILGQAGLAMGQIQTVLTDLQQTAGQLAQVDYAGMVSNVDNLVTTGQQSLEGMMEKLNSVDFEKLNQAIEDLAAVIEPLAKMAKLFGR